MRLFQLDYTLSNLSLIVCSQPSKRTYYSDNALLTASFTKVCICAYPLVFLSSIIVYSLCFSSYKSCTYLSLSTSLNSFSESEVSSKLQALFASFKRCCIFAFSRSKSRSLKLSTALSFSEMWSMVTQFEILPVYSIYSISDCLKPLDIRNQRTYSNFFFVFKTTD